MEYLLANRGGAEYLVAANEGMSAAPIILKTDEPVISLGGFGGGDPVFSTDKLADLVGEGDVRFFLMRESERENESTSWVQDNCEGVPQELWRSSTTSERTEGSEEVALLLYDCGTTARSPF